MNFEPRLSTATHKSETALKKCSVMPLSHCAHYHVSDIIVFVHHAGTLSKGYPNTIQAIPKGRTVVTQKGKYTNSVGSSCLKHSNGMLLSDPWQSKRSMISESDASTSPSSLSISRRSSTNPLVLICFRELSLLQSAFWHKQAHSST